MKELFNNCEHVSYYRARGLVLLDTCFFINFLEHHKDLSLAENKVRLATTSFNVEELIHVEHRLSSGLKAKLRKSFKSSPLLIVDVPVHPGDRDGECRFVNSVDTGILSNVPDPSDAVLVAAAIETGSSVVTRDRHHVFTAKLENFIKRYNIQVYKDLKFLE